LDVKEYRYTKKDKEEKRKDFVAERETLRRLQRHWTIVSFIIVQRNCERTSETKKTVIGEGG
jgi:hypothetical protein